MRNRLIMSTAALLLASTAFVGAQETPQTETTALTGLKLEVGGRFTDTDGDEARYERYRDLRNGANVNLFYSKETEGWTLDVAAKNIGYRDGRYLLSFDSGRVKLKAHFDQTPLNYGYDTRTPYQCTAGRCSLDAGLRAAVQARTAIGVPANVAGVTTGSIYNTIASRFDLQSRRDTMGAEARISATDNIDFTLAFNSYKRSGSMPFGAAFAFNNASELPLVIENRETDVAAGVEWASHQGMFRVGYERTKFNQEIPFFEFDNPNIATDFCRPNSANPPGACYDPSGYSNGNGPAFGRMTQAPSNTQDRVSWMGMVKLPGRTTANATFAMGANHQDEALIPWTTNTSINTPAVFAAFPELAHLPRESAQMRVNHASGTMSVSSRAIRDLSLSARYRFSSRNDFTRGFDAVEYVRFDAVPEETGGETHAFNLNRNALDVTASYTAIPHSAIRVGYGFSKLEHGVRTVQGWQDNTARVSFDTVGNQYVTLRAMYEHTKRDVTGLSIERIEEMASQPALRFYDEAARTRDRGTFSVELTPVSSVGVNLSLAFGKDDYKGADATQEFGLLDNNNTAYSVGVNYTPSAKVSIGADYGRETFDSLQESRNANPAPDPSWIDPNRNWNLSHDETVNNLSLYVNLVKPIEKTDVRLSYDFSDSDQGYVHGGPRIDALRAANTFVAFPNVTNKWHQASLDVKYALSQRVGIGFSYLFEKLDVEDFATINTGGSQTLPLFAQDDTARIDWLGGLTTGYGNRPYKGQTAILRLFYEF